MKTILASNSPRRRELLASIAVCQNFEVIPANVDETADPALSPEQLVHHLAEKKALHIWETLAHPADTVIIGADTIVAIDGLILGKPKDADDAFDMLLRLSGRVHTVFTGVSLISAGKRKTFTESTKVFFRNMQTEEIREYIATGEPFDKAGSYGIQGRGAVFIERVEGDYFTIVGLPLCRLNLALREIFEGNRSL